MRAGNWGMIAGVAALLIGSGCNSPGNPVPVQGDTRLLAGDWEGEYSSFDTGRAGSIVFRLKAGTDSAWGDVLMVPAGTDATRPADPMQPGDVQHRIPRVITISFVQCGEGEVTGRLDPYEDPDTHQKVLTTFEGRLRGNRFEGTFESVYTPWGRRAGGKWSVTRKAPPQ